MRTSQSNHGIQRGRALKTVVVFAIAALISACGGGEDAVFQELSAQQQREAAALKRAHALNADAMGKIKAERAAGQRQSQQ